MFEKIRSITKILLAAENAYEGGARSVKNHLQIKALKTL